MNFITNSCNDEILLKECKNKIGEEIPFYFEGVKTNCKVISVKNNEIEFKILDEATGEIVRELLSQGIMKSAPSMSPKSEANEKLSPCPFCGGGAFIEYVEPHSHTIAVTMPDKTDWSAFVQCKRCSCALAINAESKELAQAEAIRQWNTRVSLDF